MERSLDFLIRRGLDEIQVKFADPDSTRQCMDVVRPITYLAAVLDA